MERVEISGYIVLNGGVNERVKTIEILMNHVHCIANHVAWQRCNMHVTQGGWGMVQVRSNQIDACRYCMWEL